MADTKPRIQETENTKWSKCKNKQTTKKQNQSIPANSIYRKSKVKKNIERRQRIKTPWLKKSKDEDYIWLLGNYANEKRVSKIFNVIT